MEVYLIFFLIKELSKVNLMRSYFKSQAIYLFRYFLGEWINIKCGAFIRSLPDNIVATNSECF